nr:hypothetical protein [Tanacetum cinerariifolium]
MSWVDGAWGKIKGKLTTAIDVNAVEVTFLEKPTESEGFEQIIDFLNANPIKYALIVNPTIYTSCIKQFWATAKVKTVNGEEQIQALVDKKKVIIIETSVRSDLYLEDVKGTEYLPAATIFEQLTLMGAKTTAWNEFSSTMASAITCLATNQKFSFSKYIFDHIMKNLEDGVKFLMFPRFVQVFMYSQVEGMVKHKEIYVTPSHTKKIFANMKRQGKDFSDENVTTTSNDPLLSGSSTRVESSEDVGLGDQEDASKQERMIDDLDANEGVTLVDETQRRDDQDMFNTSILDDEEVVAKKEVSTIDPVPTAGEVVTTVGVEVSTAAINSQISMDEITLAKALNDIKTSKPKANGIVMQEPSKAKMIEPEKPLKRKDRIMIDEEVARNLEARMQAELEEEERLARQKEEEANIALIESWDNTQAMMDADYELAARLQEEEIGELTIEEKSRLFVELMDKRKKYFARLRAEKIRSKPPTKTQKKESNIESFVPMDTKLVKGSEKAAEGSSKRAGAIPLSSKYSTIVDYKICKKRRKSFFKIIRADGNSRNNLTFGQMFKNFNREELEVLWSIVKARFKKTKPVDDMDNLLFQTLKIMFEHHVEDNIWKYQQGLAKMWNDVRLQFNYEVEMAYDLLRLIRRQISKGYGRIVGIRRLYDDIRVTVAQHPATQHYPPPTSPSPPSSPSSPPLPSQLSPHTTTNITATPSPFPHRAPHHHLCYHLLTPPPSSSPPPIVIVIITTIVSVTSHHLRVRSV